MDKNELKKAYDNYSRNDLEILSINTDQREGIQLIQSFLDQFEQYGYRLRRIEIIVHCLPESA